jgi:hypothetical protein
LVSNTSFLSSVFTYQKQKTDARITTSKSNVTYTTLIALQNKLTHLNGVITPEAFDNLEDELGGIFTVKKPPLQSGPEIRPPCQRDP